jgi:phosphoenolpyruvate-protein phosphotransferase
MALKPHGPSEKSFFAPFGSQKGAFPFIARNESNSACNRHATRFDYNMQSRVPNHLEERFRGQAVAPGIGIGPVHEATEPKLIVTHQRIAPADVPAETTRLDEAVSRSRHQLRKLKARLTSLPEHSQTELEPLIDAYLHMLGPSRLISGIKKRIKDGLANTEAAVSDEADAQANAILALTGSDHAGRQRRADEVHEIARRILRNLAHQPFRNFRDLAPGSILAAQELRPSDAVLIRPNQVAGIITAEGGADSHTAVMLRALGLPAVLGAPGVLEAARPGTTAIIDGDAGEIILNPSPASLDAARSKIAEITRARRRLARLQRLPAETRDHVTIELQANLELPFELPLIAQSGAHGIGLLRSEFMFMNRESLPDEDTQTRIYTEIVAAMEGEPVTIRLLDWGSDKDVEALNAYLPQSPEPNPALGLRGIRLLLQHPALLETQLAAILRAGAVGPVRILLPMVSLCAELREVRAALDRVWRRLKRRHVPMAAQQPPLGIMIETPAAALSAHQLAAEAAFFSIGSNDLTMYALASDRCLPAVGKLYDPLEPAVLRLFHMTAQAANDAHIPLALCGELAARERITPLLLGLGVRQLSMHGAAVPRVKKVIRALNLAECAALAAAALAAPDAAAVREILRM